MPRERNNIVKASKKASGSHVLQKGKEWVMRDSGAGVPVMEMSKNCPEMIVNFTMLLAAKDVSWPTAMSSRSAKRYSSSVSPMVRTCR